MQGNRNILITGVSSGIGSGLASSFINQGYRVFGSVRNEVKASELQTNLGERFIPLVFDVRDKLQISEAALLVSKTLDGEPLEALINNAGTAEIGPLLHVSPESFQNQLDTLMVGQLRVIQAFNSHLRQPGIAPGTIYNISSTSGVGANRFFGCYAAGKHGLEGLSKTLRLELQIYGIPLVVVAPGNIATDIWPKQTDEMITKFEATDYADDIRLFGNRIRTSIAPNAMSVGEFCDAFLSVYQAKEKAERYTIVMARKSRWPFSRFSKTKVRVLKK